MIKMFQQILQLPLTEMIQPVYLSIPTVNEATEHCKGCNKDRRIN
jgi:hypothetical protein